MAVGNGFLFAVEILKAIMFSTFIYLIYEKLIKSAITIPCLACETPSAFAKCSPGTGAGTHTCEAWNNTKQTIQNVKDDIGKVKASIADVGDKIAIPITEVKKAIAQVIALKDKISLTLPQIPPLRIPKIDPWNCKIDLSGIKPFDICKDVIQPIINDATKPINVAVGDTVKVLNGVVTDINKALDILKMDKIKPIDNTMIPNVNITCNVDLAAELKKVGLDKIDPCNELSNQLNIGIDKINDSLTNAERDINIAIGKTNELFNIAVKGLHDIMLTVIDQLRQQLENLNVFKGLLEPVNTLIANIKQVNPVSVAIQWAITGLMTVFNSVGATTILAIIAIVFICYFLIQVIVLAKIAMYVPMTILKVLWGFILIFANIASGGSAGAAIAAFDFL